MQRVASAANEANRLEQALQVAVDEVCTHTGWSVGHAYLRENRRGTETNEECQLCSTGIWNRESRDPLERYREVTERMTFAPGEGLPGRALEEEGPVCVEDVTDAQQYLRSDAAEETGVKGAFAFPVTVDQDVVAVLEFYAEEEKAPDVDLLEAMESVGVQLSRVAERENARQRLRASVGQYKSLKDCAPDGIVIANCAGEITDWNQGATEIFGYEKKEILGKPIEFLMPNRQAELFRRGIRLANRTGQSRYLGETIEMKGLRKGGETFPLELSLSSWKMNGTRCYAAIIRDITERRQRENELRRSEERYRRLFEKAQEGIAITTPDGEIIDANPAARDIFGYSREALPALKTTDLCVDPDERSEVLEKLRAEGVISRQEVRFQRADGEEIVCEISTTVQHEEGGEPEAFLTFFRDVTKQKKAEEALRESEETFRKLAEGALVGIALIQDGAYEYLNPALAEITGYPRKELIGEPLKQVIHPRDWPYVQRQINRRIDGEAQEVNYESRIKTKSGETRYVEVFGTRITYQGEPAIIGTVQDVTEQRRLRRETIKVQEEERKRLGQDLHDGIASQLTGAHLMLSSLSSKAEKDSVAERIEEVRALIHESAGDVRRLSRGLNPGGLSEGDLPSALEQLAMNVDEGHFEQEVELSSQDGLSIDEDVATHLYRIAQEATSNARRYADAEEIALRLTKENGALLIEVEDDGKGFDPEDIAQDGLGIRSMQHRAELLDADLEVESRPGEGTLIRCRLPI